MDDWIGLSSVFRPRQHSIGYLGDGFYRSKDPTNSIKVLKGHIEVKMQRLCPCFSNVCIQPLIVIKFTSL